MTKGATIVTVYTAIHN